MTTQIRMVPPFRKVRNAIARRLRGDNPTKVFTIYEAEPSKPTDKYVAVETIEFDGSEFKVEAAFDVGVTLVTVTKGAKGQTECEEMLEKVSSSLTRERLTVAGWESTDLEFEFAFAAEDAEEGSYRGVLKLTTTLTNRGS